ncbi:DUF4331 domain-containing protein [Phenylobacterium sp.]|uniref:DUF4331 domain-containing protein n=1 Tax=Phenylobacterium sp. TaxID=1871053 RepID=UPI001212A76E|nr:DUF4331 domain-containing protein [Phenylobacterium sp.]THD63891.1 MAG: DUF4331 domain-containing protein [Phenylobacterium sp.]
MKKSYLGGASTVVAVILALSAGQAMASSHREAPGTTKMPKTDSTDLYMFRSYEPGRAAFVTFIANYQPFQDPGSGPNYFTMDPDAIYEIHIDNDGDGKEDLTFQFKFTNTLRNGTGITLPVGGKTLPIALRDGGTVTQADDPNLGEVEDYTVTLITGDPRSGTRAAVTNATGGASSFRKPFDNAGQKTTANYPAYANQYIFNVTIPGCATPGKVFVGQRAEAFAVNLGPTFDLINYVPIDGTTFPGGITQSRQNDDLVGKKNVTSIALEVPIACLTGAGNGVIGAWQTASLPQARILNPTATYTSEALQGGAYTQVSRLGNPLVNELVIGLPVKDTFNSAQPSADAQFADYVTNPTFPAIVDLLFRAPVNATLGTSFASIAPTNFPRNDLVATFLTGIKNLNQQKTVTASEMMRLNTAINPTPQASQQTYGVVADDLAGYPNGRRPGDDTVDITLRVAMGRLCYPVPINGVATDLGLCKPTDAPVGQSAFTDGAPISAAELQNAFPYLNPPLSNSPRTLGTSTVPHP